MKLLPLCLLVQAMAATSAIAALPPLYETLAEFKSLINSKELTERLNSGEAIMNITRNDKGFTVETNKHTLDVEVVYEPTGHPGPAHYHLVFKEAQPLK